ncbi:MAG: hypothetical protein FWE76_08650 [Symbiobacteriaceae bacterium]|nr:hypothetical protein [Symbiobacteriaceae bacterium]
MYKMVECAMILAEGRDRQFIRSIVRMIRKTPDCEIANCYPYSKKNITEIGFFGSPDAVLDCAFRIAHEVTENLDLHSHAGAEVPLGVVVGIHLSPLYQVGLDDCAEMAEYLASQINSELEVPVYLHGTAALQTDRQELGDYGWRSHKRLLELIKSGNQEPDFGKEAHPSAGVMTIGSGGSVRPVDSTGIMLYLEMRRSIAAAREMTTSPHFGTKVLGYLYYIGASLEALLKTRVNLVGWRW